METINPTKSEQNALSGFSGVARTKCSYCVTFKIPIKTHNFSKICDMINYIWWLTILQNLNKIHSVFSQESCPQSGPIVNHIKELTKSHNSCKFATSKRQLNMMNYIWWIITLQSSNKIHSAVCEELHPHSDGWTHAQTPVFRTILSPFTHCSRTGAVSIIKPLWHILYLNDVHT